MRLHPCSRSGLLFALLVLFTSSGFSTRALPQEAPPPPAPGKSEPQSPPSPPPAPETDRSKSTAEDVLVTLNGKKISVERYETFLLHHTGFSLISDFIDELLVEQRAKQLGLKVTDAELNKAVDDRIEHDVQGIFQGDRKVFLASLERRWLTLERYREWQKQLMRPRMLLDRCIMADRQVTDDMVRSKFEEMYGPGGVHSQIRHIFLRKSRSTGDAVPSDEADPKHPKQVAARLVKMLEKDPSKFGELAREYSQDVLTRQNDGFLPSYRPGVYGPDFDAAVASLQEEGQITGPIESPRGYHIIQLVKRTVTRLEDVQADLRAELESQPPTPSERSDYRERLRAEARIER